MYMIDGGEPIANAPSGVADGLPPTRYAPLIASRDVSTRARVLREMVVMVARRGYAGTSVTGLAAAAHISRATFYRLFDDLQGCCECVIDEGCLQAAAVLRARFAEAECWRDGARVAFAGLLAHFDANPDLARVLLVEVLAAGSWAIERREQSTQKLIAIVIDAWSSRQETAMAHPMAVHAAMAAAIGLMQSHVVSRSDEPLLRLLGPLVGTLSAAVLGQREVRLEIEKADALAARLIASAKTREHSIASASALALADTPAPAPASAHVHAPASVPASAHVPALLLDPRALRARAVLLYVQKRPHASNREIAEATGIAGRTQASALLGRLARLGLIEKPSTRPGDPCSWTSTPYGSTVAEALRAAAQDEGHPPLACRDRRAGREHEPAGELAGHLTG